MFAPSVERNGVYRVEKRRGKAKAARNSIGRDANRGSLER
jgi:hypothetical protein